MSAATPLKGATSSGAPQYVWERLKNTGIDYKMILSERRLWLLQQDLGRSDLLLAEWFALVQELDKVTRTEMGVDQFGTKLITTAEAQERKQRSQSFNRGNEVSSSSDGPNRPRSRSFLEYLSTKSTPTEEAAPGDVATVDLTQATGDTRTTVGVDGTARDVPEHLASGVIASPSQTTRAASATPGVADYDGITAGGDDEVTHTSDGTTPTKKKKISFRKKRKDKSTASLPVNTNVANGRGEGLSADTESSVPSRPVSRAKEPHPVPGAHRQGGGTSGAGGGDVGDSDGPTTVLGTSHTSQGSTSGVAMASKPPARATTKKKRKTKTANKALKKMFKVVEKKNSAKGLQHRRSTDGGQESSAGVSTSEREDSSATNTDVGATDDDSTPRPSASTAQKMWL